MSTYVVTKGSLTVVLRERWLRPTLIQVLHDGEPVVTGASNDPRPFLERAATVLERSLAMESAAEVRRLILSMQGESDANDAG